MACSAIYFLDMKGKVLLHRNYRGDIENTVIDKFIGKNFKFVLQLDYVYKGFLYSKVFVKPCFIWKEEK